jgi:hypothetical protein
MNKVACIMAAVLHRKESGGRQPPQFAIDQRQELFGGLGIAIFDLRENTGNVGHARTNRQRSERPMSRALRYLPEGQMSSISYHQGHQDRVAESVPFSAIVAASREGHKSSGSDTCKLIS